MTTWTDAMDQVLLGYLADGLPHSEIAARMNVSRCATVGRAHRLREKAERDGTEVPAALVRRRAGDENKRVARIRSMQRKRESKAAAPRTPKSRPQLKLVINVPADAPTGFEVKFRERGAKQCSWMTGDPMDPAVTCCGAPVAEGARLQFCPHHLRRSFSRKTQEEIAKLVSAA